MTVSTPIIYTKIVEGWGCDCPLYPHNSKYCDKRYPVVIEIPTVPGWKAPSRKWPEKEEYYEEHLWPIVWGRPLQPDDPYANNREIKRLTQVAVSASYAKGYVKGRYGYTYKGECPSCHRKDVTLKTDGDLRQHKCISADGDQGDYSAMTPVDGSIYAEPTDSIVIKGRDWVVIYENGSFYEAWVVNNGTIERASATELKSRAFRS